MKIIFSAILSLIFLVFWSCSDAGKDPLSSSDETDCTQELDCNSVCDGDGSTCDISYSQIQEILNSKCIGCHNGAHSSGLDLRTYAGVTDGGNSGDVVISENGSESRLIQKLRGTASGSQMPASGGFLDASVIQVIETWIDEGALDN